MVRAGMFHLRFVGDESAGRGMRTDLLLTAYAGEVVRRIAICKIREKY